MEKMRHRFIEGALNNRISEKTADSIFETLKGFAEYGFCKSHAAGFALLCYESAWLKKYYPAPFYAALLNNQPMGFYAPEVIVSDARRHGVATLPVDINLSQERCTVEGRSVRLGLMYVKELGQKSIAAILQERKDSLFISLDDFCHRVNPELGAVENLIMIGAFDSLGLPRRETLWQLGIAEKDGPGQFKMEFGPPEVTFPDLKTEEKLSLEYEVQGLSTSIHPMQIFRKGMLENGILKSSDLADLPSGHAVCCAGYVITRQRPGTAKGFCFLTLEDEDGMMNVILRPDIYEKHRQVFRLAPWLW